MLDQRAHGGPGGDRRLACAASRRRRADPRGIGRPRTDLEAIVEILTRAVEVGGLVPPRTPFPHPLPEVLDLGEINADPTAAGLHGASARGPLVGLRDDMRAQEHVLLTAALLAGHVAVVGGSGPGAPPPCA